MPSNGDFQPVANCNLCSVENAVNGFFIKRLHIMLFLPTLVELLRRRELGDPLSKISVALQVPQSTLRDWLTFAANKNLTFESASKLTQQQFRELRERKPAWKVFTPDWEELFIESKRPNVTVQQLYEEYLRTEPDKLHLGRSSFYAKFQSLSKNMDADVRRLCLHNSFRPSEVAMIDYSGDGLDGKDRQGVPFVGQVFVGVLGCSGLIFCYVTPRQKREDWFTATNAMFTFFDGVSEELWMDNSTPLVLKADRTDPVLSEELKNFCEHFGTAPNAVAPREPTYKGLVENAVKQVQRYVLQPLQGRQFFSIEDMNKAVAIQLKELNNRPLTSRKGETRRSRFEELEKRYLKPLPFIPYNLNTKIFNRTVLAGDRIRIDNIRYAVPWGYVGNEVLVLVDYKAKNLKIYLKDTHAFIGESRLRSFKEGDEPSRIDYVPEEFKTTVMDRDQLVGLISKSYGTHAATLAKHLARHCNSMAKRHLRGMLNAAKRWEPGEFEDICRLTLEKSEVSYAGFKKVCIDYEDSHGVVKTPATRKRKALPACKPQDVRGADYFSDGGVNHES